MPAKNKGVPFERLSPRERQVVAMTAQGLGIKEIAFELKISPHTVASFKTSIHRKLGLEGPSTARLTAIAIRHGLMEI